MTMIYNFLCNNSEWLLEQLDIPTLYSDGVSTYRPHAQFVCSTETPKRPTFNPLDRFCHIGSAIFDHVSIYIKINLLVVIFSIFVTDFL